MFTRFIPFRYDTGRQRYLVRDIDPSTWQPLSTSPGVWTDYAGDLPDGEFGVSGTSTITITQRTRYLGGAGLHARQSVGMSEISYFHGDLLGSVYLQTDGAGQPSGSASYSAFGQELSTGSDWCPGYVGQYGYEAGLLSLEGSDSTLEAVRVVHVGDRWYDASLGRFIQRDPIGIRGGSNVYNYCYSSPTTWIDLPGLKPYKVITGVSTKVEMHPVYLENGLIKGFNVITTTRTEYDIYDDRAGVITAWRAAAVTFAGFGGYLRFASWLMGPLGPQAMCLSWVFSGVGFICGAVAADLSAGPDPKIGSGVDITTTTTFIGVEDLAPSGTGP